MTGKACMKWILILLLALSLSFSCFAEGSAEGTVHLDQYTDCKTINQLFEAAESALAKGADPKLVYSEMYSLAESKDMLPYFQYALENAAAYGSDSYRKLMNAADPENEKRQLNLLTTGPNRTRVDKIGFNAYESYSGSEAFQTMIADPGAQFCLNPVYWTEAGFERAYGVSVSKFKPSRPRAGYICIMISDSSQSAPETSWDSGENAFTFLSTMRSAVHNAMESIGRSYGSMPAITGNPDLASSFWIFDLHYPFYSWYGHRNKKEVRGFNCDVSLTVIDAATHQTTAKLADRGRLGRTISSWSNGIAKANIPDLPRSAGYDSFISKVSKAIQKQDSTAVSSQRMTAINVESVLNGILLEQAAKSKNAWEKAIYESGVKDISLREDSVSFFLRGYDPGIKALGTFTKAESKDQWFARALKNASEYQLELALPVENGLLTQKGLTTLTSTVKKAASSAQQGFAGKDMTAALKDYFFPIPVEGKFTDATVLLAPSAQFAGQWTSRGIAGTGLSASQWAMICYAQKSQTINVKDGPHAILFSCVGAELPVLVSDSAKAVLDDLAYVPAEERPAFDLIPNALQQKLAEASAKAHTKSNFKWTMNVDIDDLGDGRLPEAYVSSLEGFNPALAEESLLAKAKKLPAVAALPLPKSGKITGEKSGTKVVFKLSEDSDPTYVLMRSASTSDIMASAFIQPGKQVFVLVPEGEYNLVYCSGPYWYGEELLFASLGSYTKSEVTQIKSRQYVHTFTLEPSDIGEVNIYDASPADFR